MDFPKITKNFQQQKVTPVWLNLGSFVWFFSPILYHQGAILETNFKRAYWCTNSKVWEGTHKRFLSSRVPDSISTPGTFLLKVLCLHCVSSTKMTTLPAKLDWLRCSPRCLKILMLATKKQSVNITVVLFWTELRRNQSSEVNFFWRKFSLWHWKVVIRTSSILSN